MGMGNDQVKKLALDLLRADSESEVINILQTAGLWEDRGLWRLYGDKAGNFATSGNQQSLPEASLVEKIVNSVDARLMSECLTRGLDPKSAEAPQTIRDAVATFFEGRRVETNESGTLAAWPAAKRTEHSRAITLAATGDRPTRGHSTKKMCLTITDLGEGQTPKRLPNTILSLNESNKQAVRFVQGKFNMGGSGALRFCGTQGLQLVISRRNPAIVDRENPEGGNLWGVTIVRREEPIDEAGAPVHSEFTYLAPVGADASPRKGAVLSFRADTLPLMPVHDDPYSKEVGWGTTIKLYEYETSAAGQSNILMKDGLLYALERLLPEIGLPVRLHECRGYKGEKERSFETPLAGLVVRLEEGRGDNLEDGFPLSVALRVADMDMKARIYAFKENRAATYLKNEGVIFTINGQAHGHLPKSIFSRPKRVGLPRLKDSLLVLVDCSALRIREREDLFMTSRDRLSKKPIRNDIEREIEEMLKTNPELRRLQERRREQDVSSKLSEEKPLEEVLNKVLRASPTLETLFLRGQRLSKPFNTGAGGGEGDEDGPKPQSKDFKGRKHPTFFKIAGRNYGSVFARNCELDRRVRITFETDVENQYFERAAYAGSFDLQIVEADREMSPGAHNFVLDNGKAHLNMALPREAQVGDRVVLMATVNDATLREPFVNMIRLTVTAKQDRPSGPKKKKQKRKGGGSGDGKSKTGIQLPRVIAVHEGDEWWEKHKFDSETACHAISDPVETVAGTHFEHTFYINVDNTALKTEMKYSRQDPRLLEAKFKYANVLLGLAMLHDTDSARGGAAATAADDAQSGEDEPDGDDGVADRIRRVTRSVAPVLLPMIDQLSGLDEEQLEELSVRGEDD